MLADGSDAVSVVAARALARSSLDPGVLIPAILAQRTSTRLQRAQYLDILRHSYDTELIPYVPRIIAALDDDAPDVRCAAILALGGLHRESTFRLDGSAAYPILIQLTDDPDPEVASAAREAIESVGASQRVDPPSWPTFPR